MLKCQFLAWAQANHAALLPGAAGNAASKFSLHLVSASYHTGSTDNLVAGVDLCYNT